MTGTLNGLAFEQDTTVAVSVSAGTATETTDYTGTTATLRINAGQTSGMATLVLTPVSDDLDEDDETVAVEGTVHGLEVTHATVTITDDDGAVTGVVLEVSPTEVGESAGATTLTVTATLEGNTTLASETEVTVSVGDGGTATSGTDYDAVPDFSVTIPAGMSSGTGTITLTPQDDMVAEGDETVSVAGSAAGLEVTGTELTITDEDAAPTKLSLSVSPTSVTENTSATTVTATARLEGNTTLANETEVTVSVGDGGTATSGTDYDAVPDFTVTIPAGMSSGTGTFTLTLRDDTSVERDETVAIEGTATGFTVTGTELTIIDVEAAPIHRTLAVSAWLARFGRTVAGQAVEAVSERVSRGSLEATDGEFRRCESTRGAGGVRAAYGTRRDASGWAARRSRRVAERVRRSGSGGWGRSELGDKHGSGD